MRTEFEAKGGWDRQLGVRSPTCKKEGSFSSSFSCLLHLCSSERSTLVPNLKSLRGPRRSAVESLAESL